MEKIADFLPKWRESSEAKDKRKLVRYGLDGDNWSANNVYFSKDAPDGFGDAIGYMANSHECQAMIDEVKIVTSA